MWIGDWGMVGRREYYYWPGEKWQGLKQEASQYWENMEDGNEKVLATILVNDETNNLVEYIFNVGLAFFLY